MQNEKSTEKITLVFTLLCCLNFGIIAFTCGVIGLSIQEIINMNIARDFLEALSAMPITPPYRSLLLAMGSYFIFVLLSYISIKRELDNFPLAFVFIGEISLCIFIMYCMGFSSNAIVLLFIASVLASTTAMEFRFPFLIIGIIVYILFSSNIFSQLQIISLSDFLSVYNTQTRLILGSLDSILNTLNIVVFVLFMFLLIYKEVKQGKQMRRMNDELRILNEQLKEYAKLQEKMGETKERNRLAREIHDTLGHTLTGLSVGIDAAIMVLNIDPEATLKQLNLLSDAARKGLQDVRRSVEKLRPDALEKYELQEAIEKMIADFISISKVNIRFTCHLEEMNFGPDIDEFVYRFVQEGVTNAVRHGKAKHILVSFATQDDILILGLEDDGIGCKNIKDGFGFHHMKERLAQFNGSLRANGENGFIVLAEVPLRKENYD